MRQELIDRITDEFPDQFAGQNPDFDCGDGWFALIYAVCKRIKELGEASGGFKVFQVKQKYSHLVIYGHPTNAMIEDIIHEAEEESHEVCERCGTRQEVRFFIHRGWEQVACTPCRKMIKKGWKEGCAEFNDEEKALVREILSHLLVQVDDKLQAAFPGGKAEVTLCSAGTNKMSYIVVRDAEGRIYAA